MIYSVMQANKVEHTSISPKKQTGGTLSFFSLHLLNNETVSNISVKLKCTVVCGCLRRKRKKFKVNLVIYTTDHFSMGVVFCHHNFTL
jgi:hypothetical protein